LKKIGASLDRSVHPARVKAFALRKSYGAQRKQDGQGGHKTKNSHFLSPLGFWKNLIVVIKEYTKKV
jgi:hypothetical protein